MSDIVLNCLFWMGVYNLIIVGTAGAYVSGEKNRSGAEGYCLGLFLGPIGVVAAACLPTIPSAQQVVAPAPTVSESLPPFLADALALSVARETAIREAAARKG